MNKTMAIETAGVRQYARAAPRQGHREVNKMRFQDTVFPDIEVMLDDSDAFAGILTPDGIEACTVDAAFLLDRKVLSSYEEACRSIRQILKTQLRLELPKGFSIAMGPNDLTLFCTQECPVGEMDSYLQRKKSEVLAAVEVWNRERPWDTNPMSIAEARARNFVFDAGLGALETDGCVNDSREIELPSSIDGRRVTTIKMAGLVSYPYLETLVMPDSITQMEAYAFYDSIYLRSAKLSNSLRSISEGAFGRCRSLMSIVIPDSVVEICSEAFYQCSSLATVVIPDNVESVGSCAFLKVPRISYHGRATGFPWGATVGN